MWPTALEICNDPTWSFNNTDLDLPLFYLRSGQKKCPKAETGVGAATAAGNQEEKGIWALLFIAAKTTRK
jgi:hypothetical protein